MPGGTQRRPTLVFSQVMPGRPLRVVAYGDMRFTDPARSTGTNPRVRRWLAEHIPTEHPKALLLTGDMPYTGAKAADWEEFQKETAGWRTAHILELPTMGNHELYGGDRQGIANYLVYFPEIQGHRYYSALLGNLEVISLDSDEPAGPRSAQARWFASQLGQLPPQVDFLMILYHVPWVNDRQTQLLLDLPARDGVYLRSLLEQRLARMRARVIVFSGHIHNYERFERKGVEYVVTGGGGAEPYPILFRGKADLYRDTAFPVFHYLTVDIANHKLHAVMWKVKDPEAPSLSVEPKDEFWMTAPVAPGR